MSAGEALRAAVVARLRGAAALDGLAVFDAPPDRALVPYAVVEEPVLQGLDGAGVSGRIGTLAIGFRDDGEVPARLRGLMAAAESEVEQVAAGLAGGWRVAGLALGRSRLARGPSTSSGQAGWTGRAEWAVRMFRVN